MNKSIPLRRVLISGLAGAVALILVSETVRAAMSSHAEPLPTTIAQAAPSVTLGPGSAYSYGQQGGVTAGTVNIGPQRLAFSPEIGSELLAKMPLKKKVILRTVGGGSDQQVGSEIQSFLQQNGYDVVRTSIGMLIPPPDHKLSLGNSHDAYVLTVAPSAN